MRKIDYVVSVFFAFGFGLFLLIHLIDIARYGSVLIYENNTPLLFFEIFVMAVFVLYFIKLLWGVFKN